MFYSFLKKAKYELTETNLTEAQKRIIDLQDQVIRLQNDLDNVESVQADFVRLSQNLQVSPIHLIWFHLHVKCSVLYDYI